MPPLTISDIDTQRANSGLLSTTVAGYTSSDLFKSSNSNRHAESRSLHHRLSVESRNFFGSELKKSSNQVFKTHMIPLGTGRPTSEFYPWDSVTIYKTPIRREISSACSTNNANMLPESRTIAKKGGDYDIARGLNYSHAAGLPALLRFVTEHVELVHNPPYKNWATCLSCGSTSALEVALRIFCNRGDSILTESYTYPGAVAVAHLLGVHTIGIEMDAFGLMPDSLERTLRTWDESRGPRPTVLYTIPSGQNPTGVTQSLQRKNDIYQVAEDYDLVVIEDDPYYFLCMDLGLDTVEKLNSADRDALATASGYLASLPSSLLALDISGRIVRLDSFSKILTPGLRAGWVTASDQIIDKFIAYYEVSTVAVSGPTQLMLLDLLDTTWGHLGFFSWLDQLSIQYRSRLRILLNACDQYFPKEVCKWTPPQNGMFLWTSLDLRKHPIILSRDQKEHNLSPADNPACDIEARILAKALEKGVQITMGSLFSTNQTPITKVYFRMTFAAADESEIEVGIEKVASVIREEFAIDTFYKEIREEGSS
ncbi:Aminotransferase [Lachnellula hyalina]|uniref:Aminotransferase n=1 Tax=Lachnellula hyalina TaxID=1316788 RepID=A0A8H8QV73_9HELO|nr:Aminotransferase [Lachnellula hyalina]TVY23378.1 Aminotransferase [Lachnellula hyalina]